ncbi:MAG: hypothetical protein ACOC2C_00470 [Cyclonatronaceae bacterium]
MPTSFLLPILWRTAAALLLLSGLLLLNACDDPPGSAAVTPSSNSLRSINVSPDSIITDPAEGITDRQHSVSIEVRTTADAVLENPRYSVVRGDFNEAYREGSLQQSPGEDGLLTADFSFTLPANVFETFTIYAFDAGTDGQLSNTLSTKVALIGFTTEPPEMIFFNHPESVTIPDSGVQPITFESKVVHPQGQQNISQVLLELFDSAGNRIGTGPFEMLDDGEVDDSGDLVPADSVYTRTFSINPDNAADVYEVFSYATDRQGLVSDTLRSTITFE